MGNSMAAYVTTETAHKPNTGKFFGLLGRVRNYVERQRQIQQTVFELSSLSNRELDDLNIARCDIRAIAKLSADR